MKNYFFLLLCLVCLNACDEPAGEDRTIFYEASGTAPESAAPLPPVSSVIPVAADSFPDTGRTPRRMPSTEKLAAREDLVTFARRFLGTPYVYAGSNPETGFDCSGFIYYVYQHYGIAVPRSSIDFKSYGREVPLSQAKIADLVLFTGAADTDRIGHIGIVLQAGSDTTQFLHASSGKEMAVIISSAASPHYRKRFVKVVDVISK